MGFFDDPANQPPSAGGNTVPSAGTGQTISGTLPVNGQPPQAAGGSGGGNVAADIQALAPSLPNGANTNDNKDHTAINALMSQLQAKGYQVSPGLTDEAGRMDSLTINGQVYRVLDSSGNWIAKSNAAGDAWGGTYYGQGDPRNSGGSGAGGPGSFGGLWNTLPSASQLEGMPGFQYGIDEANRALQAGAAAKGTLLNGRTQQALQSSLVGTALNQAYLPLAQLNLQTNQANYGNLYGLANLGLSGVQTGNQ